MVTRRVVCLAASIKHGGFCYAGKDIDTGEWIRPISSEPGHAISNYYRVIGPKDPAKVGDVLDMKLGAPAGQAYQSENYEHVKEHWKRIDTIDFDEATMLADHPASLWKGGRSSAHGERDDLTEGQANSFNHSLCLIAVEDLCVICADEGYEEEKYRTRARFTCLGVRYCLSITDPEFFDYGPGEHPIGQALLCCSLAEAYAWQDGSRHVSKLVASIITRDRLG